MKLECKLEIVNDRLTSKGDAWTFTYIPVKDAYQKYMKLVVSGDLALDVLKTLELPYEQGDTIEIELKPKQTQSKLPKKNGKTAA